MDFLVSEWMGKPFWMWKGFLLIVLMLLAFDLGVLNRKDKEMGVAQSLWLSAFISPLPCSTALAFGGPMRLVN